MTGQCPPVKSLFHDPDIIEKYPYMPWIEKVFEHAVWRPHHPMYTHISHILQEEIHAALTGLKSPKAALDSAARRIAKLLGVGCPYCKS